MASRRFWFDGDLGIFGSSHLLEQRFLVLDDEQDLQSIRIALGRPPLPAAPSAAALPAAVRPASALPAAAPPASAQAVAAASLVPNISSSSPVTLFGADLDGPFAASLLGPQAGGSFVLVREPDQGSLAVKSLAINAGTREILTGGATDVSDMMDGRDDQLVIGGSLGGPLRLDGAAAQHESLVVVGNTDTSLVASDADIEAGEILTVTAAGLGGGGLLDFDGSAESDGAFTFLGAGGNDRFTGGAGNDKFWGADGGDTLAGGGGADFFHYVDAGESSGPAYDSLVDFNFGNDLLDLPVAVAGFDSTVGNGSLSEASFDADLAAALGAAQLGPGRAAWFTPDAGDLAGQAFLVVDGNGQAGYQPGEDFVFLMAGGPPADLGDVSFFV